MCGPSDTTSHRLLVAHSVTTALLCLLPLLLTLACYALVMRSVWLAREVRTESASEYNRVVLVTFLRLLSLLLTYFPVCLMEVMDVTSGVVPDAARRYVGHLLWLQSAVSPFVTLQDNDFRDKLIVPDHVAGAEGKGPGGRGRRGKEGGVMPDIGSSGGQDGEEHRARNIEQMNQESRRQLQRGISFISSADMKTIRGSND